jgi:hypothetical protein
MGHRYRGSCVKSRPFIYGDIRRKGSLLTARLPDLHALSSTMSSWTVTHDGSFTRPLGDSEYPFYPDSAAGPGDMCVSSHAACRDFSLTHSIPVQVPPHRLYGGYTPNGASASRYCMGHSARAPSHSRGLRAARRRGHIFRVSTNQFLFTI